MELNVICPLVAVILVLAFGNVSGGGSPRAVFSRHQFGILDSQITFTARIENPNRDKYTIYWSETRWMTKNEPRTLTEHLTKDNHFESDWTLDFPSSEYHIGNYTVTGSITYDWGPFPIEFATELVGFTLTDEFTGKFCINNVTRHRKSKNLTLVSTKNETEIKIDLDSADAGYLKHALNSSWTWFNSSTNIANTSQPVLRYNFTEPKTYEITARLQATFNGTNSTIIKTGNFSTNITAKGMLLDTSLQCVRTLTRKTQMFLFMQFSEPITNVNLTGETWYRNDGRLLRLKITCDGSGPYQYCLMIKEGSYNITGNETCPSGGVEVTNDCEIFFVWLLGEGMHTLITVIENDLGRYLNQTAIFVYKVSRVQPLSLILVPITCSLIALVLIIFGIGYFWENRKRYAVEVADFDFGQHDELPYMTFVERLKDAMSSSSINRQRHIPPPDEEPILNSRRSSQFS